MVAIIALLALTSTQQRVEKDPLYFDESYLGASGMAAFNSPDSVTVQRVYPVKSDRPFEMKVGNRPLNAAGKEKSLNPDHVYRLRETLQIPQRRNLSLCLMHPDHVVRFKKAETVLAIITCYSCQLMDVTLDGKHIGGTSLPGDQSWNDLLGYISVIEDNRATWDERNGRGFFDALMNSPHGTFQRIKLNDPSSSAPSWQEIGEKTPIPVEEFVLIRTTLAFQHAFKGKSYNVHGIPEVPLASDLLLEFESPLNIRVVFPSDPVKLIVIGAEGKWLPQGASRAVRQSVLAELTRMAAGQ